MFIYEVKKFHTLNKLVSLRSCYVPKVSSTNTGDPYSLRVLFYYCYYFKNHFEYLFYSEGVPVSSTKRNDFKSVGINNIFKVFHKRRKH